MKIISKFKDYYDYLTGVYGVDPLVIYNRRPQSTYTDFNSYHNIINGWNADKLRDCLVVNGENKFMFSDGWLYFFICNKRYMVFCYRYKFYATKEECQWLYDRMPESDENIKTELGRFLPQRPQKVSNRSKRRARYTHFDDKEKPITINTEVNCPSVLIYHNEIYFNPKLESFGIAKLIPPKEIFLSITNFLSKKEIEMPSSPQDMYRYEAKGFDKKTSFRPKMK